MRANRCGDGESKANCLACLPVGLREPPSQNVERKGSANSASKQVKKRVAESLRRALQTVSWSDVTMKYEAEFIAWKDLEASMGPRAAEKKWRTSCFGLAVKEVHDMPKPVTQAEAMAVWRNRGYSWNECLRWWYSLPESVRRVEAMRITFLCYFEHLNTLL